MLSLTASAQNYTTSVFDEGDNIAGVSVGFGGLGSAAFGAFYERGFMENLFDVEGLDLGLGGQIGYYGDKDTYSYYGFSTTSRWSTVSVMARGAVHYQLIDKLDTYAALNLGMYVNTSSVKTEGSGTKTTSKDSNVGLSDGMIVGARYYLTDNLAGGVELGFGNVIGNATICISYKF